MHERIVHFVTLLARYTDRLVIARVVLLPKLLQDSNPEKCTVNQKCSADDFLAGTPGQPQGTASNMDNSRLRP